MVTLKDIARECKVSFSTVSKALQGSHEISEETIRKIQKKADEMGYHPNIAARTLRTNRTYDIGVIFEDKTGSGFQHQYFAKIISGLQEGAQNHNYDITFTGPGSNKNYDYFHHINSRSFDGVIILSSDFNRSDLREMVKSGIPVATMDFQYDDNHICILSDNKQGMSELTEYVISRGHKKIAMVYGEDTRVTEERRKVFLQTLENHGIKNNPDYMIQARYHDTQLSAEAAIKLLELNDPPTCIFFPDDYSALGGIREINKRGLIIGKDISIVGYDGILLTSMMEPPLTTFEQDGVEIGKRMVSLLIDQIETKTLKDSKPVIVSGKLLEGGTVAKLN